MKNLSTAGKSAALLSLLVLVASVSNIASAADPDGKWAKEHPRRAEVNGRLAHQNERIKEQVKSGEMSKDEAATLHQEHKAIRQEERTMAAGHDGHITKAEKKELNKQENAVSKQIGK
jgi:hypothetical protein